MTALRIRLTAFVLIACAFASPAAADDDAKRIEVTLNDGTVVRGEVTSETDDAFVLSTDSLGVLTIERADVKSIADLDAGGAARRRDPDVNSILFIPTSETLPKGDAYYRNFEILFNNFGFAVTDDIALSAMFAFPLTGELELGSVGAKVRLLSREEYPVGVAVAASHTFLEDESATTLNGIVSVGDRRRSLSVVASVNFADDEEVTFVLVGGDVQVSRNIKLLAEYGNATDAIFDDADFNGLVNVGFRAFWSSGSFTLTGLRPLEETGDELFAIPFGQVSLHF